MVLLRRRGSSYLLLAFISFTWALHAQQPGKPKDPTPFERPKALITVSTTDSRATFQKLVSMVAEEKFQTDGIDSSNGQLSAFRKDSPSSPNQDKILVWLERDFEQPQSKVHLYLVYGRYEQFFGANGDLTRVKVDADFENQQVGKLRQRLIDFASSGGGQ